MNVGHLVLSQHSVSGAYGDDEGISKHQGLIPCKSLHQIFRYFVFIVTFRGNHFTLEGGIGN